MYCINYKKSQLSETGWFSWISKLVKLRKQKTKKSKIKKNKTKKTFCFNWSKFNFLLNILQILSDFKCQSYKMVLTNCLSVFDYFVGLTLKELRKNREYLQIHFFPPSNVWNKGHAHLAIFFCVCVSRMISL